MYELFGRHKYYVVSVSQLTNNNDRTDSNGIVGKDEVVEVGFTMSL